LTTPKRIQHNLTARAERRVLDWLCARLPLWLTPDRLTTLGMLGAVMVAAGFGLSNYSRYWLLLAVAGFAVNWFGDSLDGSIARHRKIERPNYGYFIDHSLDALATLLLVLGMAASPYLRMDTALVGLVGYLLLSVHTFIAAKVTGQLQLSFLGGGPTEMRLALIALTAAMFVIGPGETVNWPVGGLAFSPFDVFVAGLGAALIAIFVFQTARTGADLLHKGG
jgi:archaetidylinositol phosphate synthase